MILVVQCKRKNPSPVKNFSAAHGHTAPVQHDDIFNAIRRSRKPSALTT
jgi:hypothetical protein